MNTWRLFNLDYVLLAYTGQILKSMAPKHAQSHPTSSYMSSGYYRKSSLIAAVMEVIMFRFLSKCV